MAALSLPCVAAPTNDGLFATLHTSMGDITVELEFTEAPRTVANFVSLAEGTRAWVDFHWGRATDADYYDGVKFHRVVSNFVIQAGLPVTGGSSGPGYTFADEFSTNLTHHTNGTLSMANSGPNSNGSQFFLTLRPTPELDFDKEPYSSAHTVFGYTVEGMGVVSNIGAVATSNEAPLVDVVINDVTITRNGAAASNFNPLAVSPTLPEVSAAESMLLPSADSHVVAWTWQSNTFFRCFATEDLNTTNSRTLRYSTWTYSGFYITSDKLSEPQRFYDTVKVEYH